MNKLLRPLFIFGKRCVATSSQPVVKAANAFQISKHRSIMSLYDLHPSIGAFGFIAPNATVIGDIEIANSCVIWGGAVLRGDMNAIRLMNFVIVGERSVIHTANSLPNGMPAQVSIGNKTMIQNDCTLYSCTIGEHCFIGYKSVILEGAKLEDGVVLGPKTVVPPGRIIPANQLWAGNPAQYVRDIQESDLYQLNYIVQNQHLMATTQSYEYLPQNSAYLLKNNSADDLNPQLQSGVLPHENYEQGTVKL